MTMFSIGKQTPPPLHTTTSTAVTATKFMSPHALTERDFEIQRSAIVKQSPRKISKSNSDVFGKHLLSTSSGLFKNLSTDFFGNFNESSFGNEVIYDLFPGLGDTDKKDDKRKDVTNNVSTPLSATNASKKTEPLFSSAYLVETPAIAPAQAPQRQGYNSQQPAPRPASNQPVYAAQGSNKRVREPTAMISVPVKQILAFPGQMATTTIAKQPLVFTETKQQSNGAKPATDEISFETRSGFSPVSPADHFSLRLAQQVVDITFLPYRVKEIKDSEDEFVEKIEERNDAGILMGNFSGIIKSHDGREITSVADLSNALLAGSIPPLTSMITTALNSPIPRSVGAPTNVNVAQNEMVDLKTLKKLRNRVSASRCRLRRRVWATGIDKTEKSLLKLNSELDAYVARLEAEKAALAKVVGKVTRA